MLQSNLKFDLFTYDTHVGSHSHQRSVSTDPLETVQVNNVVDEVRSNILLLSCYLQENEDQSGDWRPIKSRIDGASQGVSKINTRIGRLEIRIA